MSPTSCQTAPPRTELRIIHSHPGGCNSKSPEGRRFPTLTVPYGKKPPIAPACATCAPKQVWARSGQVNGTLLASAPGPLPRRWPFRGWQGRHRRAHHTWGRGPNQARVGRTRAICQLWPPGRSPANANAPRAPSATSWHVTRARRATIGHARRNGKHGETHHVPANELLRGTEKAVMADLVASPLVRCRAGSSEIGHSPTRKGRDVRCRAGSSETRGPRCPDSPRARCRGNLPLPFRTIWSTSSGQRPPASAR